MYIQILIDGTERIVYSKKEWMDLFRKYCDEAYLSKGESTGAYCCGYHWCCDKCALEVVCGCADCVVTIVSILEENGVEIDTSDLDFENWEKKARELL